MSDEIKIIRWETKGWAGVDFVSILNPSPHLVEFFSEENAQGKTSLLEALKGSLAGAGAIGDRVIRDGASKAECDLDLGAVLVHCTVSQKGRSLTVKTADGRPVPKAQTYLDGIVGKLLCPAEFREWDAAQQLKALQNLAGAEWVAKRAELATAYKTAYDERSAAKRVAASMGTLAKVEPAEPVNIEALSAEAAEAEEFNKEQTARQTALDAANQAVARAEEKIKRLLKELEDARGEEVAAVAAADALPRPEKPRDTSEIRQRLAAASATNASAAAFQRYQADLKKHTAAAQQVNAAERAVETAASARDAHEATARLPEGLKVAPDGVTYLGRPLARMSTGEGYRLAFAVAAHLGHKIVILDNAEAAGPKVIAAVEQLAREYGMQVVMATRGQPHTPGAYELLNGRLATEAAAPGLFDEEV